MKSVIRGDRNLYWGVASELLTRRGAPFSLLPVFVEDGRPGMKGVDATASDVRSVSRSAEARVLPRSEPSLMAGARGECPERPFCAAIRLAASGMARREAATGTASH